jgi:hypothetical protein
MEEDLETQELTGTIAVVADDNLDTLDEPVTATMVSISMFSIRKTT